MTTQQFDVLARGTKAAIEALTGLPEGALAYATDTDEFGTYDGSAWTWGQGGAAAWGSITGTLSSQTDLQAALDGKANTKHAHQLGPNEITNGTFATDLSGWTAGAGWSWESPGRARHTASNTAELTQSGTLLEDEYYNVSISIGGMSAGAVNITLDGGDSVILDSNGDYTARLQWQNSGGYKIRIIPSVDFDGYVDTIVVAQTPYVQDTLSATVQARSAGSWVNLGTAAQKNVGTASTDVAAGDHLHSTLYREKLAANRTYYVRTDGSDSNDGLTNNSGGAFLTIQRAVDVVATLDINGYNVTIQVADGTYSAGVTLKNVEGFLVPGNLVINGNGTTPTNVVISSGAASSFSATGLSSVWRIANLKVTNTGTSSGIISTFGSLIQYAGVDFGACGYAHVRAIAGYTSWYGNCTISGNSLRHISAESGSVCTEQSFTMTITANVTFTEYALVTTVSAFMWNASTISTGAFTVTGKKYTIQLNGVGLSGGVTLPGTVAGTTATGGQYS